MVYQHRGDQSGLARKTLRLQFREEEILFLGEEAALQAHSKEFASSSEYRG